MPPSSQMVAILQLTLLLISCSLYSMLHSSSSSSPSSSSPSSAPSSLALLVLLVVSTCLSLLFASLRRLLRDTTAHRANHRAPAPSMEAEAAAAAAAVFPEKSVVSSSPLPQGEAAEDFTVGGSGTILSDSSECATTNDDDEDEGTEEEGSVSDDDDDESLIEISLVDGHYVGSEQAEQRRAYNCNYKKDLLADLLPDLLLDRRDFIFDILSKIGEEDDSLIEIDLARGSIKCDVVKA
ncbi:hypothetical protein Zm00014a_040697 [Zea mays]|uniref:Uncharacterized protein n=1 Tax=Zea mays TaxID=4577 RepID=A0A3L6G9Q9_MAIZE|nr:hypothetical protein Zm00014a_040697 [Zea mays]